MCACEAHRREGVSCTCHCASHQGIRDGTDQDVMDQVMDQGLMDEFLLASLRWSPKWLRPLSGVGVGAVSTSRQVTPRRHPTQNRTLVYLVDSPGRHLAEAEYAEQMHFKCIQPGTAVRVVDYRGTSLYEISPMYLLVDDSAQVVITSNP